MAYRPGLDEDNFETVYGSDGSNTELRETVAALETDAGSSVWQTSVQDGRGPNSGNVITDDTKWGPSLVASGGSGVYVASGPVVQCYDTKTGSLLWSYRLDGSSLSRRKLEVDADDIKTDSRTAEVAAADMVSRMEIIDGQSVLVAVNGMIVRLTTFQEGMPTNAPAPTVSPAPTRSPTPSPTRSEDTPSPTEGPRSAAPSRIQHGLVALAALCLTTYRLF
ncbi:MAG: hypothetical protein SGARI_002354 [Bacillariaceae sp.]